MLFLDGRRFGGGSRLIYVVRGGLREGRGRSRMRRGERCGRWAFWWLIVVRFLE